MNLFIKMLKILWLLILPALLAAWLFWIGVELPLTSDTRTNAEGHSTTYWKVDRETNKKPSTKKLLKDIFQIPFDLTYYKLCLKNDSYLDLIKEEPIYLDTTTTFYSLGGKELKINPLVIPKNTTACAYLQTDEFYYASTYQLTIKPELSEEAIPNNLVQNVDSIGSPTPIFISKLASTIIFILAWWTITLLLLKVIELLGTEKKD